MNQENIPLDLESTQIQLISLSKVIPIPLDYANLEEPVTRYHPKILFSTITSGNLKIIFPRKLRSKNIPSNYPFIKHHLLEKNWDIEQLKVKIRDNRDVNSSGSADERPHQGLSYEASTDILSSLFSRLNHMERLKDLKILYRNGDEDNFVPNEENLPHFFRALRKMNRLEKIALHFSDCPNIKGHFFKNFMRWIKHIPDHQLKEFRYEVCDGSAVGTDVMRLVEIAVLRQYKNLRVFSIYINKELGIDQEMTKEMIQLISSNLRLISFEFFCNVLHMNDSNLEEIAECLKTMHLLNSLSLGIKGVNIITYRQRFTKDYTSKEWLNNLGILYLSSVIQELPLIKYYRFEFPSFLMAFPAKTVDHYGYSDFEKPEKILLLRPKEAFDFSCSQDLMTLYSFIKTPLTFDHNIMMDNISVPKNMECGLTAFYQFFKDLRNLKKLYIYNIYIQSYNHDFMSDLIRGLLSLSNLEYFWFRLNCSCSDMDIEMIFDHMISCFREKKFLDYLMIELSISDNVNQIYKEISTHNYNHLGKTQLSNLRARYDNIHFDFSKNSLEISSQVANSEILSIQGLLKYCQKSEEVSINFPYSENLFDILSIISKYPELKSMRLQINFNKKTKMSVNLIEFIMQECFKDLFIEISLHYNLTYYQIPDSLIIPVTSSSFTNYISSSIMNAFNNQPSKKNLININNSDLKMVHFCKMFQNYSPSVELYYNEKSNLFLKYFRPNLICFDILDGIKEYYDILDLNNDTDDIPYYYSLSNFPLLISKLTLTQKIDLNLSLLLKKRIKIDFSSLYSSLTMLESLKTLSLNLNGLQIANLTGLNELFSTLEKLSSTLISFSVYFDVEWYETSPISDEIILQILNSLAQNGLIAELGFSLYNCDTITNVTLKNLREILPKYVKLNTLYLDLRNTRTTIDEIVKLNNGLQSEGLQIDISMDETDIFSSEKFKQACLNYLTKNKILNQSVEQLIKVIKLASNVKRIEILGFDLINDFSEIDSSENFEIFIEKFENRNKLV